MYLVPRYVYVGTYVPGLHPPKNEEQKAYDEIAPKKEKMYLVPRYVYVDTYVPGLHPPPQKEQKAY